MSIASVAGKVCPPAVIIFTLSCFHFASSEGHQTYGRGLTERVSHMKPRFGGNIGMFEAWSLTVFPTSTCFACPETTGLQLSLRRKPLQSTEQSTIPPAGHLTREMYDGSQTTPFTPPPTFRNLWGFFPNLLRKKQQLSPAFRQRPLVSTILLCILLIGGTAGVVNWSYNWDMIIADEVITQAHNGSGVSPSLLSHHPGWV